MHRIKYLRFAVIKMTWAKGLLSRASAGGMNYQGVFSQLEASIQQEREENAASMRVLAYSGTPRNTPEASDRTPGVFFSGQARYGRSKDSKSPEKETKKQC
jgi:hypothetical protein